MRGAVFLLAFAACALSLAACADHAVPATPDAFVPPNLSPVDVGAACDRPVVFCADYAGLCVEGTCRAECSAVEYPRCDPGYVERHDQIDGADRCTCAPAR